MIGNYTLHPKNRQVIAGIITREDVVALLLPKLQCLA